MAHFIINPLQPPTLTQVVVVGLLLLHLPPQCPQLPELALLGLDLAPQPLQDVLVVGEAVLPRLLLLQELQSLLFRHQQLLLGLHLLLLAGSQLTQLGEGQRRVFWEL